MNDAPHWIVAQIDIIHAENMPTDGNPISSPGQARSFRLLPRDETPFSCGESLRMIPAKSESTVPSSETKVLSYPLTLSERLTPLLISAGLVRGTTLTFGRRLCARGIPAGVSYAPDGGVVVLPQAGWLF